jgi:hypothetical protein
MFGFHVIDKLDKRVDTLETQLTEQTETTVQTDTPTPAAVQETTPAETETEPETEAKTDARARDIELLGRTIWGEAGGVESTAERAAVAWCILNRVDAWGKTIEEVVTAPHQFYGYRTDGTCPQEHLDLAEDVLSRWESEKLGTCASGRTLPAGYLYFTGDGSRNHFTKEWGSSETWTWVLPNPYK